MTLESLKKAEKDVVVIRDNDWLEHFADACYQAGQEDNMETCETCGGDGKETCTNPDHGMITAIGGETQRLGCPVCGHDENHKVKGGGKCEDCNGTGKFIDQVIKETRVGQIKKDEKKVRELVEFISHDMNPDNEAQRKAIVEMYIEHYLAIENQSHD